MKKSGFILAFVLMWRYLVCRTNGAVVNINLAGFQDGVLNVPQNNEFGEIQVDLTEAVTSVQATVVCSSLETGPGITAVEFTNVSAPVGTTQVDVSFRIISPGRPVTIQCSAQSEGSNPQFTLPGSKGNNGSLRVIKAPTVHICPDVILVHKYLLKSTVEVQFSEMIQQFVVKVKCSVVEPEPGGPAVLQLRFTETIVNPDVIRAQAWNPDAMRHLETGEMCSLVSYEIVALGAPVQVVCSAQSTNLTQKPPDPTPSTHQLSSSVNQTVLLSSVNQTSVSASLPVSSVNASASVIGGSSKRRRRRSILSSNRTVHQYQFSTSAGPPVTFALDVSPLRIMPRAGFIRAPNGSFSAVLALDQPADNTVDITCSLDKVSPGADLSNTSGLCSNTPTDKLTFANSTVEIKLDPVTIEFQTNELFKNIKLTLSGSPAWRTEDVVRVTCCGRDTSLSLRYVNETAVAFIWVEVRKLQPVDWNSITSGQRKATLVSDIDLSCPCDLKENSCDTGCCCDQDCSDFENENANCIPGFFGGATSERPFEFSCQASWPDARDWQPFLCVAINNSPFTGYFYNLTSPSLAQDSASFNSLARNKKRESFTFVESEERRTTISSGLYTVGTSVKTAANAEDVNYVRATVGVLSLPQTVFNGLCSQDVPVRFLEQVSSRCVLELEESLCNSQSPWSALNYLMPIQLNRPTCVQPPSVLAQGRLNETGGPPELATTDVRYYCTDIAAFVSAAAKESENSLTNNSSSLFESSAQERADPTRCAFDDGETLPPAPVFNKTTRLCTNVVVKVEYEFEWRDRRIDAVKARVTLGNVQIPAVKTNTGLVTSTDAINTLSQSFSVNFTHSPLLNSSNFREAPFQRSGNPGYLLGRPVLSRLENSSGQVIAGKLQVWSPGHDGLCAGSKLTPILYGEDALSGCLLRLSFEDMRNCSYLREMVRINQNRLIQATHVGRSGNANLSVLADWLPVIREPISNNSESSSEEGTCPGIPSGVIIEMLVTDAGKYGGVPQLEIVGTRIKFQFSTWQFKCVSGVSCSAPSDTDTNLIQLVPSPSATPATAASSTVLDTSQATMSPLALSSVLNSNLVHPSLLSASSSTSGSTNITEINPNFVPSSLLPASSSTSGATNITDINPNFVPPSLLPASSSTSGATNITDINPNFVPPSLLPASSSTSGSTNITEINPNFVPSSLLPASSSTSGATNITDINPNFVPPSLLPASSSTSGATNITDINPNFVPPSLLPASSSTSGATNITDINPNFLPPSLLPASSSNSGATNITDINPNFVPPSLLPATSSNDNATNMKVSSGSSPTAAHSSLLSPTASSLSSHLTVSSSVSPPASGTENTRNYPPHFQYFMVTSSVVFIKVPAVKPQRVKRSVDQTGICYRDVCKEELFLPLTEAYQGEPREKSLALSLFLIFLALVTFAVTRPWG